MRRRFFKQSRPPLRWVLSVALIPKASSDSVFLPPSNVSSLIFRLYNSSNSCCHPGFFSFFYQRCVWLILLYGGPHHLVPLHLNLFVKLSITLSTGGHLLMIDAAPVNVMDESPATWWDRGWGPHTSAAPAWCEGDTHLVSADGEGTKAHWI